MIKLRKGEAMPMDGVFLTEAEYETLQRDKKILDELEKVIKD